MGTFNLFELRAVPGAVPRDQWEKVLAEHTIIPDKRITGGVPFKIIGDVKQKHMDFWTYGKQLYVDLANNDPGKLEKL